MARMTRGGASGRRSGRKAARKAAGRSARKSIKKSAKKGLSKAAAKAKPFSIAVPRTRATPSGVHARHKARPSTRPRTQQASSTKIAAPSVRRRSLGATALTLAPGLQNFLGKSPALQERIEDLAQSVRFTVAPKTVSGESIQAQRGRLKPEEIDKFKPALDSRGEAEERLKQLGFQIIRLGRFGITAHGPAKLVSEALHTKLVVQARPHQSAVRSTQQFSMSYLPPRPHDLFVAPEESLTLSPRVSDHIDDFVFIPPPSFFVAPSASAPQLSYFNVDSTAIRKLLKVPPGASGTGVRVALVDTGFFKHPYYAANNLAFVPTPTASSPTPEDDGVGHGTAIAYNVFAVAPGATVLGFKQTDPPQNALEDAADAGVDIISCSWGWDYEQSFPILEATLQDIIREGKVVLFASGNGQQAWPGSMREVLSIGGVYADQNSQLEASNYASGFTSNLYPGRRVPDVSGLCGQKPKAVYIVMPCPPGCELDQSFAGTFPNGDGTKSNDGWVGASGTSSATPQIAGVAALMIEKARGKNQTLTTDSVRNILQNTAVAVQQGSNAQGFPAVGTPNAAVGYGLVDATAALNAI
jgi:serine protease AprX